MPNELDPIPEQWYTHLGKGQRFYVTAIDEPNTTVEVQHFDGDIEEFSLKNGESWILTSVKRLRVGLAPWILPSRMILERKSQIPLRMTGATRKKNSMIQHKRELLVKRCQ